MKLILKIETRSNGEEIEPSVVRVIPPDGIDITPQGTKGTLLFTPRLEASPGSEVPILKVVGSESSVEVRSLENLQALQEVLRELGAQASLGLLPTFQETPDQEFPDQSRLNQ